MVLTAILLHPAIRKVVSGRKERRNAEEDDEKWKRRRGRFCGRKGRWELEKGTRYTEGRSIARDREEEKDLGRGRNAEEDDAK